MKAILFALALVIIIGSGCTSYRYESSERDEYTPKNEGGYVRETTRSGSGYGYQPRVYIIENRNFGQNYYGGGYQVVVPQAPSAQQLRGLVPGGNN